VLAKEVINKISQHDQVTGSWSVKNVAVYACIWLLGVVWKVEVK